MSKLKVLLTGASGKIGSHFVPVFRELYELRTLDRRPVPGDPQAIQAELTNLSALRAAMDGVEVVVHLAAKPNDAPFLEELLPNNIVGTYNVLQAAHEAQVRRVVFASTCQTITLSGGESAPLEPTELPQPIGIYGATKVWGEVLGRFYHQRHRMEFIGIRIGWFHESHPGQHTGSRAFHMLWLSPRDAVALFRRAVEADGISYGLVFGTSKTHPQRLSLRSACELLGYEPVDDVDVTFGPAAV